MREPIKIWRFEEAPRALREMSRHGGDEDWIAVLPKSWVGYPPLFLEEGNAGFGFCSVSRHELPDGRVVLIGAHA